ncbi:class I SAM-dependent methyltransferase [Nocardioides acrostichi]|uniref:Class I SAM-dependent methyltransferase n=1 Tax=Nocardioides acrostichi TaxID=2784339 RepID=A0A930Y7D5_9ACTN|nr:class I SAM-dependent methyltransferase [Nocardioides acrostichi]MBF4161886.1 class I SAM-dependent methyltransferase [Nocardioides acrostichi]
MRSVRVLDVDERGIRLLVAGPDRVVDVCFDGRRIWSFWVRRDTERGAMPGLRAIAWPGVTRQHLRGRSAVTVREHVSDLDLWAGEVVFTDDDRRVDFIDRQGNPISLDKSGRFSPEFSQRTEADLDPLLDAVEALLGVLNAEGVAAFPAYGTLLGAVREGEFLGHDSDADLGYVSRFSTPVDAMRESFRLQRVVAARGWRTYRYSGLAFRVSVEEGDGNTRGLDVFGGFFDHGRLYLMGEVGAPFRREWIEPLGTTTLAGRELPAPARPEKLLEAMYGPGWKVPDPAFKFETPPHTVELLNQWFRGTAHGRRDWERRAALRRRKPLPQGSSPLARHLKRAEPAGVHVLDVGAGRGRDAVWLARRGLTTTAYDYVPRGLAKAQRAAQRRELPLAVRELNLLEWRSVLSEGARLSRIDEPRVILARHLLDATDEFGRQSLGRFASMALRGGGRLYVETWTGRGGGPATKGLVPVRLAAVEKMVARHGGTVLSAEEKRPGKKGEGTGGKGASRGRLVAQWT